GATDLVARFIPEPSREEQGGRLDRTQKMFLSQGLTGIHDFDGISSTLSWNDLREADRQHIRVTQHLRGNEVPWAIETGWHTGDGDDWLRRGGLKLFSDGALDSHTSQMSSPLPAPASSEAAAGAGAASDAGTDADGVALGGDAPADGVHTYPGTVPEEILDSDPAEANYGIAQMSEDDLFENAKWATEAGISVAIHAIGDQANHHVLN